MREYPIHPYRRKTYQESSIWAGQIYLNEDSPAPKLRELLTGMEGP
ncbi:MAG: hypothetical protein AAFR66_03625 [Bacteroidota bacterium]